MGPRLGARKIRPQQIHPPRRARGFNGAALGGAENPGLISEFAISHSRFNGAALGGAENLP